MASTVVEPGPRVWVVLAPTVVLAVEGLLAVSALAAELANLLPASYQVKAADSTALPVRMEEPTGQVHRAHAAA